MHCNTREPACRRSGSIRRSVSGSLGFPLADALAVQDGGTRDVSAHVRRAAALRKVSGQEHGPLFVVRVACRSWLLIGAAFGIQASSALHVNVLGWTRKPVGSWFVFFSGTVFSQFPLVCACSNSAKTTRKRLGSFLGTPSQSVTRLSRLPRPRLCPSLPSPSLRLSLIALCGLPCDLSPSLYPPTEDAAAFLPGASSSRMSEFFISGNVGVSPLPAASKAFKAPVSSVAGFASSRRDGNGPCGDKRNP